MSVPASIGFMGSMTSVSHQLVRVHTLHPPTYLYSCIRSIRVHSYCYKASVATTYVCGKRLQTVSTAYR